MSSSHRRLTVSFDEKKIDAIFSQVNQCHRPGAMAGIAIDGRPVYRKGFGLASLELPIVLSPSVRLFLGSTTKHFTALSYMLLCEDGKASIDDPVGKYLPELHPVARKVTMRHLMTNTSGLRDATDIVNQTCGWTLPRVLTKDIVSLYRDIEDVNAAPGTTFIYNNGGWNLLAVAIERIADRSLEEVMRGRIFEPAGMYDTEVRRWDSDFYANCASPHCYVDGYPQRREYTQGMDPAGAGCIISNVNDMLRWMAHMDAPRVGSEATWRLMKTPQKLANGTSTGYGFGLFSGSYRGVGTLYHGGGGMGSNTQMLKVPAAGLDVEVMVNSGYNPNGVINSGLLANQILDACLPELDPVDKPFTGPVATGVFRSPNSGRVIQLLAQNGQQFITLGGNELPMQVDDMGVLRSDPLFGVVSLEVTLVGDRQTPSAIRVADFGNYEDLLRVPPADRNDAGAIVGRYSLESAGAEIVISATADGARLNAIGRYGAVAYDLQCIGKQVWRTLPVNLPWFGGLLSFDQDCRAFSYSNLLTRNLRLKRIS